MSGRRSKLVFAICLAAAIAAVFFWSRSSADRDSIRQMLEQADRDVAEAKNAAAHAAESAAEAVDAAKAALRKIPGSS